MLHTVLKCSTAICTIMYISINNDTISSKVTCCLHNYLKNKNEGNTNISRKAMKTLVGSSAKTQTEHIDRISTCTRIIHVGHKKLQVLKL